MQPPCFFCALSFHLALLCFKYLSLILLCSASIICPSRSTSLPLICTLFKVLLALPHKRDVALHVRIDFLVLLVQRLFPTQASANHHARQAHPYHSSRDLSVGEQIVGKCRVSSKNICLMDKNCDSFYCCQPILTRRVSYAFLSIPILVYKS